MRMCGHELGKNWYSSLKNKVSNYKMFIDEFQSIRDDLLWLSQFTEKRRTEESLRKIDDMIRKEIELINAEKKNLEMFTDAVKSLPEREKKFATLHYMEGETIEEISFKMGYSTQQIHRIKKQAIKLMEEYITTHKMPF